MSFIKLRFSDEVGLQLFICQINLIQLLSLALECVFIYVKCSKTLNDLLLTFLCLHGQQLWRRICAPVARICNYCLQCSFQKILPKITLLITKLSLNTSKQCFASAVS